jgi:hypothetical protein
VPRRYKNHLNQDEDLARSGAGQWDDRLQAIQRADDGTTWILIALWTLPHLVLLIDVVTRKLSSQEEGYLDSRIRPDWAHVLESTDVVAAHTYAKYEEEHCFRCNENTKESIWHYNSTCKQNIDKNKNKSKDKDQDEILKKKATWIPGFARIGHLC